MWDKLYDKHVLRILDVDVDVDVDIGLKRKKERETPARKSLSPFYPDLKKTIFSWHLKKSSILNCRKIFPERI